MSQVRRQTPYISSIPDVLAELKCLLYSSVAGADELVCIRSDTVSRFIMDLSWRVEVNDVLKTVVPRLNAYDSVVYYAIGLLRSYRSFLQSLVLTFLSSALDAQGESA